MRAASAYQVEAAEAVEPALPLWVALSDDACKACAQQPEVRAESAALL
jgi:hypothetical protein